MSVSTVERAGVVLRVALHALGWGALAGSLAVALHDASLAWDSWYYHLPFAARLVGLVPAGAFVFHPANEARFAGFALLAELLQGALWKVTGRPESANLVAFASVPLVAWFMKRRWGVPFALTALGLLAIPLVQAHAPSCYVDLPGNAAVAMLALLVVEAYAANAATPVSARLVALALALGTAAANMKPLLQPLVGVLLLALFVRAARSRASLALVMVAAAPLVAFTPLKNAIVHHNPFFPIEAHVLGVALPGPEAPYASSPAWLAGSPRPLRFACSLLEIGIRPLDDARRWTVDQWMPEASGGNRLGGFFGAYVVASVALFALCVVRDRSRESRAAAVVFGLFTGLVACMPQSHELRYYLSWMILLVCLNLALARRAGHARAWSVVPLASVSAAAFVVVVASTRAAYVYPSGLTVDALVRAKAPAEALGRVGEGETICVRKEPFNLLWAAPFHPPRRYVVREAEEPADCGADREVSE